MGNHLFWPKMVSSSRLNVSAASQNDGTPSALSERDMVTVGPAFAASPCSSPALSGPFLLRGERGRLPSSAPPRRPYNSRETRARRYWGPVCESVYTHTSPSAHSPDTSNVSAWLIALMSSLREPGLVLGTPDSGQEEPRRRAQSAEGA